MAWTTSDTVMTYRTKWRWFDVFAEMMDGWRRHLSGRNASLLAFFGFLSVFPLLLAATTVLGFVLENNEELREDLVEGALSDIPGLSTDIADGTIQGNTWALVLGLAAAIWSSTKAFVGLQGALDDTWEIDVDDRAGLPVQRGKAVLGILILGGAQICSVILGIVVREAGFPAVGTVALIVANVGINALVIAAMYRFLTSASPTWNDVWLGAAIAGVLFTLLQYFGTDIVRRIQENAGDTYGQFALVLGIVTWMGFVAIATLMCAELNAARVRLRNHAHLDRRPEFDLPVRP